MRIARSFAGSLIPSQDAAKEAFRRWSRINRTQPPHHRRLAALKPPVNEVRVLPAQEPLGYGPRLPREYAQRASDLTRAGASWRRSGSGCGIPHLLR
jgi:hypothetical protein